MLPHSFEQRLPELLRRFLPPPGAPPAALVEPPYLMEPVSIRVYKVDTQEPIQRRLLCPEFLSNLKTNLSQVGLADVQPEYFRRASSRQLHVVIAALSLPALADHRQRL